MRSNFVKGEGLSHRIAEAIDFRSLEGRDFSIFRLFSAVSCATSACRFARLASSCQDFGIATAPLPPAGSRAWHLFAATSVFIRAIPLAGSSR